MDSTSGKQVSKLAWFTVHQFIGTYGVIFVTPWIVASVGDVAQLFGRTFSMRTFYWTLTGTPYFPVQISLALGLGFLIYRHFRHRVMCWAWIIPLALLTYALATFPASTPMGVSRVSHFFGWGCRPENHCMDQTTFTLPFYVSCAYVLGAFLAEKAPDWLRYPNPRFFWIYLVAGLFFLTAFSSELLQLVELLRAGGQWQWAYLRSFGVVGSIGVFLIFYSIFIARAARKMDTAS